jgi:hypothetical protein
MAYGLQVYNTNGNVLINTDDQTQMQVKSTFTLSTSSSFSRAGDFIAFNRTSAGSTKLNHNFNQSGSVTLNCARIRPVDEDDTLPASGSHGIKIFDAGGINKVTFSDGYTKAFSILSIIPPGVLSDQDVIYSGSLTNVYVGTVVLPIYNQNGSSPFVLNNYQWTSNSIKFINYFYFNNVRRSLTQMGSIFVFRLRN